MKRHFLLILLIISISPLPIMGKGCRASGGEGATSLLCLGNSFTYVDSADVKLRHIAASQGHDLSINSQTQGGYTFQRHLRRDETLSAIIYYRYDYVFMQDQSQTPALYAQSPRRCRYIVKDACELANRIRMYSPGAQIIMEQTWAYPAGNAGGFGSMDEFDRLLRKGAKKMARRMHAIVSPIGEAFRLCRESHPEIALYSADGKHQSAEGAYLKACVNYLLLFPVPFSAPLPTEGLSLETVSTLATVAEQTVLR